MTIALRGKTAPTSVSVYHELDYANAEPGKAAEPTGAFVFGPMPVGFVLGPKEAERLVAYLTGKPIPDWSEED